MITLSGALLAIWTVACILIFLFFSVMALAGLLCTLLPPDVRIPRTEFFSIFTISTLIAGLFYIHLCHLLGLSQETPEPPKTRDILLTVPEESSVNAQVTSGNNTVNIKNL